MKHKIFAYGSLMCVNSCEKTIKRKVDYQFAKLMNFQRAYNAFGEVVLEENNKTEVVCFANLKKNKKTFCYGLIFEVSEEELQQLIQREKNYRLVDVSENILPQTEKVWAFMYDYDQYHDGIVLKRYLDIMSKASIDFPLLHNQIIKEIKKIEKKKVINESVYSLSA